MGFAWGSNHTIYYCYNHNYSFFLGGGLWRGYSLFALWGGLTLVHFENLCSKLSLSVNNCLFCLYVSVDLWPCPEITPPLTQSLLDMGSSDPDKKKWVKIMDGGIIRQENTWRRTSSPQVWFCGWMMIWITAAQHEKQISSDLKHCVATKWHNQLFVFSLSAAVGSWLWV